MKPHKKHTFNKRMEQARSHMNPLARGFSKVIHIPGIDPVSEALSRTLLRPVPLIFAAVVAIGTALGTWIIAKHYGYQLSGSESSLGFLAGWVIGLLYDYTSLLFRSKKDA